jgi:hypothetical protein
MTLAFGRAMLVMACGLLGITAGAVAGTPSAGNSTVPRFIYVVGYGPGLVPDPVGTFFVIVQDAGNYPIADCPVTVDLGGCTDMQPCATASLTATTDFRGWARFTITGEGMNLGSVAPIPGPGLDCATIRAAGVVIGQVTVVVFDENGGAVGGQKGVQPQDFVCLLKDWGSGVYYGRSDFDRSGPPLDPRDFGPWLQVWGLGGSYIGCP